MRKYTILTALIFVAVITTCAQDFTIRVAGGYAGAGIQNAEGVLGPAINPNTPAIDALVPMANINDSLHTYKAIHGSYGSGGNVTVAVGYAFNKYIAIDLGIAYAHSNDISCNQVRAANSFNPPIYLYANISSYSYAIAATPSLTISGAKTGWKVYPYGRFGITLPVAGKLTDNVTINTNIPTGLNLNTAPTFLGNHTEATLVTQATVSVGFGGALGIAYRPLPFMNIFAEVNGQHLIVRAKSSTVTKWTADGVSDLQARGLYRTQINYVDELTGTSNNAQYNSNYNPNAPKQDTRPTVPGSNLGFNVGATFFLSKKTLKKKDKDDKK